MKNLFSTRFITVLVIQSLIIVVLATSATFYINKLALNSENIVKDNLRSVTFCAEMEQALFSLHHNVGNLFAKADFEKNLKNEMNNITELDEKNLAEQVQKVWSQWILNPTEELYDQMLSDINRISEINVTAIEDKNLFAQNSADQSRTNIILLAFFSVLVALLFTFIAIGQVINPFGKANIKQTIVEELSRAERMQ